MRGEQQQRVQLEQVQELEARVREQPWLHLQKLGVRRRERASRARGRQPALRGMHSILLQLCGVRVMFCFVSQECSGVWEPGCGRSAARWNNASVKINPRREPRRAKRDVEVQHQVEKVRPERVRPGAALDREIQAQVPRPAAGSRQAMLLNPQVLTRREVPTIH